MCLDARGIESLPVALLLSTLLAASTLALGLSCLDVVQRLNERQRAIECFDTFVTKIRTVIAGGPNSLQIVELETPNGKIVGRGGLLQLWVGDEILKSEIVSLPVLLGDQNNWEIRDGCFAVELQRDGSGKYMIRLRRLLCG
jgi:hypothetical protein